MYFDSLDAVLTMDGHGAFVWAAYLVTGCVIAVILTLPVRRRRRLLRDVAGELRRSQSEPATGSAGER